MQEAYRLQDAVEFEQADIGKFEVPDWNKQEVEQMRETINVVASTLTDTSKMFGKKEELDPALLDVRRRPRLGRVAGSRPPHT